MLTVVLVYCCTVVLLYSVLFQCTSLVIVELSGICFLNKISIKCYISISNYTIFYKNPISLSLFAVRVVANHRGSILLKEYTNRLVFFLVFFLCITSPSVYSLYCVLTSFILFIISDIAVLNTCGDISFFAILNSFLIYA